MTFDNCAASTWWFSSSTGALTQDGAQSPLWYFFLAKNDLLTCIDDRITRRLRFILPSSKPQGLVARVNIGQTVLSVRCKDTHKAHVIEALRRSKFKFPGNSLYISIYHNSFEDTLLVVKSPFLAPFLTQHTSDAVDPPSIRKKKDVHVCKRLNHPVMSIILIRGGQLKSF